MDPLHNWIEGALPTAPPARGDLASLGSRLRDAISRALDRREKTATYLRAGIAEVWLVDPDGRSIDVVTSAGVRHHDADTEAASDAVPGFALTWSELERERA